MCVAEKLKQTGPLFWFGMGVKGRNKSMVGEMVGAYENKGMTTCVGYSVFTSNYLREKID